MLTTGEHRYNDRDDPAAAGGSGSLSAIQIGMLVFLILYVPLVFYLYGRQRRWSAAVGWSLLVAGVVALGEDAGSAFPWAGLLFIGVALLGGLLVAMDLATRPRGPKTRR